MGRNLGRLSLLQLSTSTRSAPTKIPTSRRLNAAAQIRLIDRRAWEATIGAGIGGLLPAGGQTGAFDASGALSLHHKYYQEKGEDEEPFKSGVTLGSMWRPQDPFRAESPRLFGITGKLSVLDMVILSVEHHRFAAESGVPPSGAADPGHPLHADVWARHLSLEVMPNCWAAHIGFEAGDQIEQTRQIQRNNDPRSTEKHEES